MLFAVEAAIALWLHDPVIRPYAGDSLAVVLVYLALRATTTIRPGRAILAATLLAFAIEISQYFHLVRHLGLGSSPLARALLGTGFDWKDFAAYLIGAAAVVVLEQGSRRAGSVCAAASS